MLISIENNFLTIASMTSVYSTIVYNLLGDSVHGKEVIVAACSLITPTQSLATKTLYTALTVMASSIIVTLLTNSPVVAIEKLDCNKQARFLVNKRGRSKL
jgi:hypothetical protein